MEQIHFSAASSDESEQHQQTREALARRAAELEVAAQVSLATATILNSTELLQTVVDLTQQRFGLQAVNVGLLAEDGRAIYMAAAAGEIGRDLVAAQPIIAIDQIPSLIAQAARSRHSVVANDVSATPGYLVHPLLTTTRSELVVPIIVGDNLIGIFDVQSTEPDHFGPDEERIFTILAAQLGIALQNAWRFEKIEKFSAELEESRQFLDSIIENMPTPLFVKEVEGLRIVRSNKANEQLVGMKAEELLGKNDYELFPQEQAAFFTERDRELLATGRPLDIPEQPIRTASGEIRLLYTRKVVIKDADGKPKYILGISEDITERKQLEQQIEASWDWRGRQVQTSTEVAQEIAAAPALDELFERVVHLVQARFGYYYVQVYTVEDQEIIMQAGSGAVGQQLKAVEQKFLLASEVSLIAHTARSGQTALVADVHQDSRWLYNPLLPETRSEITVPIKLGQGVLGVLDVQSNSLDGLTTEDELLLTGLCGQIAIAIDYRRVEIRRQQVEEQLKSSLRELEISNREWQEFAFIASHDLQEPLRKIQAFSDRLQAAYAGEFDARAQDYLKRLQQAAAHMQHLIADYLAFSRVSAMAQASVEVNLTAVIHTILQDFEPILQDANAKIIVQDLLPIEAELSQMYLLFRHLLSNALKFRQENLPLQVHIHGELAPPGYYRLTIADNGIGFEQRYVDRIFRAFQRLHGRQQYEGTGMGLAICRKVVERHHGSITAASSPGQGATFIITLPRRQPPTP